VGEDPTYILLGTSSKVNDRVVCGPIGGRSCLELTKHTPTNTVGQGLLGEVLQLILKVGNNVTKKDKLRRYVEGLKDEVRTVIRVGMVDERYEIFAQVKARLKRPILRCGGRAERLIPLDRLLQGRPRSHHRSIYSWSYQPLQDRALSGTGKRHDKFAKTV
jgi:hypothetical protein